MANLNKVQIIGRLGADPEMRFTANGRALSTMNVAVNRNYTTQDGERREETEWVRVVAWARLAELVSQYLSKGRRAYVEGRLHSHSFQGNDGQTRFRNEIIADRVLFLDRAGRSEQGSEEYGAPGTEPDVSAGEPVSSPDDLPF